MQDPKMNTEDADLLMKEIGEEPGLCDWILEEYLWESSEKAEKSLCDLNSSAFPFAIVDIKALKKYRQWEREGSFKFKSESEVEIEIEVIKDYDNYTLIENDYDKYPLIDFEYNPDKDESFSPPKINKGPYPLLHHLTNANHHQRIADEHKKKLNELIALIPNKESQEKVLLMEELLGKLKISIFIRTKSTDRFSCKEEEIKENDKVPELDFKFNPDLLSLTETIGSVGKKKKKK